MTIPIVFFNFGNPNFLDIGLKQASHHNPDADIYLIGDDTNYKDYVKYIHYTELMDEDAIEFNNHFINLSTNNEFYEKICFLRWFLIRNLAKQNNINRLFATDSDVMYYCDITKEAENFKNYRYTLTHNVSAGIGFINDIKCLDQFCEFTNGVYNSLKHGQNLQVDRSNSSKFKYYYDKFSGVYEIRKRNLLPGGVCDMTFWGELRLMDNPGLVGETSAIINNSTFDHNINATDSYEWKNGIKNFVWKDKIPYCHNKWLNRDIKFNCVHFQGAHRKALMKNFATYQDD
jgi:hypothetical protein